MSIQSKIEDVSGGTSPTLPEGALALSFRNVTFGYDDALAKSNGDQPSSKEERTAHAQHATRHSKDIVLHDISFQLRPGAVLGLLGRTGSGKTTLTRLIFRLYDPDQGGVYLGYDGGDLTDVRQVPLFHLRHRVGMVTQNIQLFNASVRDNLTFFDRDIPDGRILQVLRDLGLWTWYESLPEGLGKREDA